MFWKLKLVQNAVDRLKSQVGFFHSLLKDLHRLSIVFGHNSKHLLFLRPQIAWYQVPQELLPHYLVYQLRSTFQGLFFVLPAFRSEVSSLKADWPCTTALRPPSLIWIWFRSLPSNTHKGTKRTLWKEFKKRFFQTVHTMQCPSRCIEK